MKVIILVWVVLIANSVGIFSQELAPYALFKAGKYREAIAKGQELIDADTANISSYSVMGWSYLNLGQWKQALNIAKKSEKISKNNPGIIQILGEAYYELKEYDNAKKYFSKYLDIAPNGTLRGWVYYYLGSMYAKESKWYKAEISYSTAVYLDNDKVQWWMELASIYGKLDKQAQAENVYKKVLALDSNNRTAKQKLKEITQ